MIRHFRKLVDGVVGWSLLYTAARMLTGLISLPVAAVKLSQEDLGIHYFLMGLSSLAWILDFGLANTVSRNTAFAYAGARELQAYGTPETHDGAPNLELLGRIVSCVRGYYLLVAGGLLLVMGTVGSVLVYRGAGGALPPSIWIIYLLATCYNFATMLWPYLLMGVGRVLEASKFGVLLQTVQGLTLILGLLAGFGLWAVALAPFLGALVVRPLMKKVFLKSSGLDYDPPLSRESMGLLKIMWPMAWRQGVTGIGTFLQQRSSILLAGSFLGMSVTGQFGLTTNTLSVIYQTSTILLFVALPKMSQLRVQGDYGEIRKQFFRRSYFGLVVGLAGGICLLLCGNYLLHLIGSKTQFVPAGLFAALIFAAFWEAHTGCYMQLCISGNHNPFVMPLMVTGLLQVLLTYVLLRPLGLWSFVVAKVITEAPFIWWWSIRQGMSSLRPASPNSSAL